MAISARAARPDLLIVARATDEDAAKKLELAGADRVVQPYSTAGREMAMRRGVVVAQAVPAREGPAERSLSRFEVHEGTTVRIDGRPVPESSSLRTLRGARDGWTVADWHQLVNS